MDQPAAALLVEVRAEAQPVDVLGQHGEDVVIDPGIDVDELRVVLAGRGVPEVSRAGGLRELTPVAVGALIPAGPSYEK